MGGGAVAPASHGLPPLTAPLAHLPLSPLPAPLPAPHAQTPEDRELKERLELAVTRLRDPQREIVAAALELLRKELREATSR
jgi:hypothetical protein